MNDLFQKVTDSQDGLQRLMAKIPGVGGYLERQQRRATDKIVRETVTARYEEQVKRISELQGELVSQGAYEYLDDVERAVTKLRIFIDGVKTAAYGYEGLFSAVKIDNAVLARIYEHDLGLLNSVDALANAVGHVEENLANPEGLPAAIRNLTTVSQQAVDMFESRKEILSGIG